MTVSTICRGTPFRAALVLAVVLIWIVAAWNVGAATCSGHTAEKHQRPQTWGLIRLTRVGRSVDRSWPDPLHRRLVPRVAPVDGAAFDTTRANAT